MDSARAAGTALWPADSTTAGHLARSDPDTSLAGLPKFLADQDDRLTVLSEGSSTPFEKVIEVTGQHARLRYPTEDLVFAEK